jgi:hypothetical protein
MIIFGMKRMCFVNSKETHKARIWDSCDVDSGSLVENSFTARYLAGIIRNSREKPKGTRWNFEYKLLALSLP